MNICECPVCGHRHVNNPLGALRKLSEREAEINRIAQHLIETEGLAPLAACERAKEILKG